MNAFTAAIFLAGILCGAPSLFARPLPTARSARAELPGPTPDGRVLLPNQWLLRPAGRQIALGDFPVNIAAHPSGRYAAVLHCGYSQNSIWVVDLKKRAVINKTPINPAFYGLIFSADGRQLICSGGADEVARAFQFDHGRLENPRVYRIHPASERGIPAGLALSPDGQKLYVANVWGQTVSKLDLRFGKLEWDLPLSPEALQSGGLAPPPGNPELAAAAKRRLALLDPTGPDAPFPYGVALDATRGRLYVSLWARASVAVLDSASGRLLGSWPVEEHPNELILSRSGRWLFVANANRNTVSIVDPDTGRLQERLFASLDPQALPGSTPDSLALSPDDKTLFVANACNNTVAVFDVSSPGQSRSLGFIPVGWYPTSVRVTPDGKHLLVANGKGVISKADPYGPQPVRVQRPPGTPAQYIGDLFRGTLSVIDLPRGRRFLQAMKKQTAIAYACNPPQADLAAEAAAHNPIPTRLGEPSPIRYCIYVIKENRTYDQILGDLPQGNGDPKLCLFGDSITPNEHKIVRDFVLLDNFYVDSEVSADGHEWSMGAYATDFVEKTWPLSYGHDGSGKFPYPSEGHFLIAYPASGYLWDRARQAGVSYRSYGEFIDSGETVRDPGTTRVAALKGHFDPWYRGWDLMYPDVERTRHFLKELKRFEEQGGMPRLQILRLPNDHTFGTAPGKPSPIALIADNDLALGQLVEGVSHSKFWPHTAIFVLEDDAQDGPDHVDAHRSTAYVVSPYARRRAVDSTLYSTTSMLRTIELILGLQPLSQFDLAARPMFNSFQRRPDLSPFDAAPAKADLHQRNAKTAWGGAASQQMDFSKEDAADESLLNEIIWRSVRGAQSPMPAPTRAAFVFPHGAKADDD